jgi:hypothetical protein
VGTLSVAVDQVAEIARDALADGTFRRTIQELVRLRSELLDRLLRNGKPAASGPAIEAEQSSVGLTQVTPSRSGGEPALGVWGAAAGNIKAAWRDLADLLDRLDAAAIALGQLGQIVLVDLQPYAR